MTSAKYCSETEPVLRSDRHTKSITLLQTDYFSPCRPNTDGYDTSLGSELKVKRYYDIQGDLNDDCFVDFLDLAILVSIGLKSDLEYLSRFNHYRRLILVLL